jgi:anaerobic selenocysteine-containing dehydrogenase
MPAANARSPDGNATSGRRTVHAACPHDCPDTCAMRVTVEGDRVIRIQGDPDHPPTHGALCTKVSRYAERTEHPERVLHPLRRVNGKHEPPRWERVSWDAALDEIAARLKAIAARDPEAIVPYSYAGTMGLVQGEGMAARFWHALGAARLDRTICASAGGEALLATYGRKLGMHVEHFAESRLIVIWGSNSIASNLHFWTYAQQAKRAGAKLVCIDPRRTETAEKCHEHLQIRPGTDGALALGVMHELFAHGWIDAEYVARAFEPDHDPATGAPTGRGVAVMRERAAAWTPERTAEVCGLTADAVRALARDLGTVQPAAIRLNYGMQRVRGGGNAVRLVALLPCLTGAWRHRAGGMLLSASGWFPKNPVLERPDLLRGRQPRIVNMSTIGDALAERRPDGGHRLEAVVVYNSNPVAVAPESPKVVAGFARPDLFTVVLEHFMTDTADLADFVLPATTQLEHLDIHLSYGHTHVMFNEPAIPPRGESRSNTEFFRQMARRFAIDDPCFTDPCFSESDEDLARQAFVRGEVFDASFDELRAVGWAKLRLPEAPLADGVFPTPTGKVLVDAPGLGVPDFVPNHESAASTPELARRYPLAMISPPARHFLNSTFVNVRSLRSIEGEPILEMHPSDAAPRGLASGQRVRVFNDRGSYRCTVQVGDRARPGVVNGLGIWWRKLGVDGTNVNEVTSQALTDIGRAPTFYDCLVEVQADTADAP